MLSRTRSSIFFKLGLGLLVLAGRGHGRRMNNYDGVVNRRSSNPPGEDAAGQGDHDGGDCGGSAAGGRRGDSAAGDDFHSATNERIVLEMAVQCGMEYKTYRSLRNNMLKSFAFSRKQGAERWNLFASEIMTRNTRKRSSVMLNS